MTAQSSNKFVLASGPPLGTGRGVIEKKLAELAETLSFWQSSVQVSGSGGKMTYQADGAEPPPVTLT